MAARSEGLPRRESTCRRDRRPKSNVTMGGGEALGQNREDAHYVSAKSSAFLSASESMRALKSFTVLRKSVILRGSIASAGAPSVDSSESEDCTPPMSVTVASCHDCTKEMLRNRACNAHADALQHNAQSSGPPSTRPTVTWTEMSPTGPSTTTQVTKSVTIDCKYVYAWLP